MSMSKHMSFIPAMQFLNAVEMQCRHDLAVPAMALITPPSELLPYQPMSEAVRRILQEAMTTYSLPNLCLQTRNLSLQPRVLLSQACCLLFTGLESPLHFLVGLAFTGAASHLL
jgi:hypothetical protein